MTDPKYSERPPHMPPGWVAIPASALKPLHAQAMIDGMQSQHLSDPEGYRRSVGTRMFIDIAQELDRLYRDTIKVRLDPPSRMSLPGDLQPIPDERWGLVIWCVDPLYMEAREKARADSRTTERAQAT